MRLAASEAELRLAQEQVVLLDASLTAARMEIGEAHAREAALQAQAAEMRAAAEAGEAAGSQAAQQRESELRAALAAEAAARRAAEAEAASVAAAAAEAEEERVRERKAAEAETDMLRSQLEELRLERAEASAAAEAAQQLAAEHDAAQRSNPAGHSGAASRDAHAAEGTAARHQRGLPQHSALQPPPPSQPDHSSPQQQQQQLQVLQVGISRDEVASLRRLWQSRLEGVSAEAIALSETVAELQEQVSAAQNGAPCAGEESSHLPRRRLRFLLCLPSVIAPLLSCFCPADLAAREVEVKLLSKQLAETQAAAHTRTSELEARSARAAHSHHSCSP